MTRFATGLLSAAAISASFHATAGVRPTSAIDVSALSASATAPSFDVVEKSIAELQQAMTSGEVSSHDLVAAYLARIAAYDKSGPKLNAMIALNPRALAMADALDKERAAKGPRGPLHGIPSSSKTTSRPPICRRPAAHRACRIRSEGGCLPGCETARGGRRDSRQDEPARARGRHHQRQLDGRPDAEPVQSRAQSRRVERRHRRGGGREFCRGWNGQRHLRIDPNSVRPQQSRRVARDAWPVEP